MELCKYLLYDKCMNTYIVFRVLLEMHKIDFSHLS